MNGHSYERMDNHVTNKKLARLVTRFSKQWFSTRAARALDLRYEAKRIVRILLRLLSVFRQKSVITALKSFENL